MSFADIAKRARHTGCVIGGILDGLPADEAEHFSGMLASDIRAWPHVGKDSIQKAIEDEGYGFVGEKPIRAHRAGTCACFRDDR